jgi:hypothetical protein
MKTTILRQLNLTSYTAEDHRLIAGCRGRSAENRSRSLLRDRPRFYPIAFFCFQMEDQTKEYKIDGTRSTYGR